MSTLIDQLSQLSIGELKKIASEAVKLIAVELAEGKETGIGTELFESLFGLVPQPCVEAVIVDNIDCPTEVLFTRRSDNDPTYPGRWHCPGTYIRLGESNSKALGRCVKRELGVEVKRSKFAVAYNHQTGCDGKDSRHTIGLVHLVELQGEPTKDTPRQWVNFNPCNIIEGHQSFLVDALGWQRTNKSVG